LWTEDAFGLVGVDVCKSSEGGPDLLAVIEEDNTDDIE